MDTLWHEPLTKVLYWYLAANGRGTGIGVDTGLMLAQTVLELLAWTYCVRHLKMVSEQAFSPQGLSAADRLGLLGTGLEIPLAIPDHLKALHARRGRRWTDGMDAITGVRNALVHPTKKQLPDGSYYEAWCLSLWYLDLILLRLCGYAGDCANCLSPGTRWVGEVEPVP